jgi:hypothetical protein
MEIPSVEDARAVLAFLPELEEPEQRFYLSRRMQAFVQVLHERGFIRDCGEPGGSEVVDEADVPALIRLLTRYSRQDRFVGGTMAGAIGDGTMLAIVRRLGEIYGLR